ncbi:MAG: sugar ABC transporter permease, partial [Flavobacteriaceae bacterium]|nr:sugar ABC transporter permease [Flavobacteriaceae bacterium]
FVMSLYQTDLLSPGVFVGLKNYEILFRDPVFIQTIKNNILLVCGSLIAHLLLGLFLANILFNRFKGNSFFQSVFFLPSVVTGVAVGLTWTFMYSSRFGLVNSILDLLHLAQLKHNWLSDKDTAMLAIVITVMWQFVGYHVALQLAAMRGIPGELYESAAIDGATGWQQFFRITLPLIRPVLRVDAILIITGSLKFFDLVFVMTRGGPNHATEVLSTFLYYQGFHNLKYGYASAIGNVLLFLCVLAIVLSNIVFRSDD